MENHDVLTFTPVDHPDERVRRLGFDLSGPYFEQCSGPGEVPTALPHTGDITMTDNAYSITNLKVSTGDEVTFRFRNDGGVTHEAIIGTAAQQKAHEAEMKQPANGTSGPMAGMDHGQPGTEALRVKPGKTEELTHRFTKPGTVILGCHEPGHYATGMKITIDVSCRRRSSACEGMVVPADR